ncbi:ADP-ribose pyrophosphatase [Aquimarina sp. EL_43]|uniref:NUDIX domain-containing protein n=1 Tax=Aquimarina TaxID=290174 RepID=UPI0004716EDD|nr:MULTISPECIES: NUDIX hydrolase [Aquimarina]MBG6129694.1 ADP-ribose pyrophosphatase [Aquimarina sp. EL_35]MBG6150759.1 ADP-ribose pyrophosphatase [Aquimarina sp. EL_32]MBG6167934.1 ADP-ribose pyrophosphatase [Aquimarina sp. EL_43]
MNYKILDEDLVYDGFLKIKKAVVTHDRFHKSTPVTYSREMVDRGDSVAILLYEKDTNHLILINQFRYPTTKNDNGWLIEIPAGGLEENEDPVACAIRETEEETGYQVNDLRHITTFYATPGGSSERMYLYYAEVSEKDKIYIGGGLKEEEEDIELCKYHISEIDDLLISGKVNDAKTIIALQWFKITYK